MAAPIFATYFKELYTLYPKMKRKFELAEYVLMDEYEGKLELYTKNSPLPRVKKIKKVYKDYLNEENEVISPEVETDLMETLSIADDIDDLNEGKGNALHPARKVPLRPVSEDSGELF